MASRLDVGLKRVYEPPEDSDGLRVLVERLWPRGLTREKARVDLWLKDLAPSTELRRWFSHDPDRWDEFRRRYHAELDARPGALAGLRERLEEGRVTLVFASRDTEHNNSVALLEYLSERA